MRLFGVCCLVVCFVLLRSRVACGLVLKHVHVPAYVVRGANVTLWCEYDLQNDGLYTVKWYKDDNEFYNYEPKADVVKKFYPQQGIRVDVGSSNATHVQLMYVALHYAGSYMCEVSCEKPFYTLLNSSSMHVLVLPDKEPDIVGVQSVYRPGDMVRANCTCRGSIPAATLAWYINDERPALEHLHYYEPHVNARDQRLSTTLGVHFRVHDRHVNAGDGRVHLRCVQTVPDIEQPMHWSSARASARVTAAPTASHVLDNDTAVHSHAAETCRCLVCRHVVNWFMLAVSVYLAL